MERIGIFGGTFNPPHIGHLHAVDQAIQGLELDRVFVIPAATPPHKRLPQGTPSAEDRFEMTRQAFSSMQCVEVLDIERRRGGMSYTAETLRDIREIFPEAELWLLVGTDMFMSLHTWRAPEEIVASCGIGVLSRAQDSPEVLYRQAEFLTERYGAVCRFIKNKVLELSSTEIRENLRTGGEDPRIPEAAMAFIRNRRLYEL